MVPVNRDERALSFSIVCRSQSEKASAIELFESLGYENGGVSANTWESFPYVFIDCDDIDYHIEASGSARKDATMTVSEAMEMFDGYSQLNASDIADITGVI